MTSDKQSYIVAVDGGGSSCRAAVSTPTGQIIGSAQGGPANLRSCFATTLHSIQDAVARAYQSAGLPVNQLQHDVGFLGLAGASFGDMAHRMEARLGFAKTVVTTDREITVRGALGESDGTVALIGTGSFFVRRHKGVSQKIGGWGFQLGDEAGGAWLGRQALSKTLHAVDGITQHSALTHEILKQFGDDPLEIIGFTQSASPLEYGTFAPLIADANRNDDPIANVIFSMAVETICTALDTLDLRQGPLVFLGGLGPTYQNLLPSRYASLCVPARGDALSGAVNLAQVLINKGAS